MLKTKSIQLPPEELDGTRICIMRKPPKEITWDMYIPSLAPSLDLLDSYHQEAIGWDMYAQRFEKEVVSVQQEALKELIALAQKSTVTILCWEAAPDKCHRRLTAEACMKLDPSLELEIL